MKTILNTIQTGIFLLTLAFASLGKAQDHDHSNHAKHNMVLYGDSQLYLSHLVYKVPHNYQVILAVKLSAEGRTILEISKAQHPEAQHIFQLDEMDISQINTQKMQLKGTLSYLNADGKKIVLGADLPITEYSVIYFSELPLSLAKD